MQKFDLAMVLRHHRVEATETLIDYLDSHIFIYAFMRCCFRR